MANKLCTVIFFNDADKPFKYRNVVNYSKELGQFENKKFYVFARGQGAVKMNVYDKGTRQFIKQVKVT